MGVENGNRNGLLTCRTIAESDTHRADSLLRGEQGKVNSAGCRVVYQAQE